MTLSGARTGDEARRLLTQDVDPNAAKKARKRATKVASENTFEAIAREWIRLPNELFPRYDDVPAEDLWGGKLLENLCQSLARVIIMQAALRLFRRGYRFVLQAHDELVFCIPDDRLEEAKTIIMQEMTRPPAWMPELPLQAEIGVGNNYGEVR